MMLLGCIYGHHQGQFPVMLYMSHMLAEIQTTAQGLIGETLAHRVDCIMFSSFFGARIQEWVAIHGAEITLPK
jgi:hypothetical protein